MDMRSVKNTTSGAPDEYIENLRQKIGTEFTDQKNKGKKKNELGKDDFIKLMSAQLKHQDPINPMKNEQMAAQLAQFSALEQMVNVNTNLEKMSAAQKPQDNILAASLIGKRVLTDSSKFAYEKGAKPDLKFELPADAEKVSVTVVDAKGEVMREYELGGLKKGPQAIKWDGKNQKGQEQLAGEYSFRITATDASQKAIDVKTSTSGLVSGVVFESGKPWLIVDEKKIPLEGVGRIEADLPKAAAGTNDATGNAVNSLADKQEISTNQTNTTREKNTNAEGKNLQAASVAAKMNNVAGAAPQSMDGMTAEQEELNGGMGAYPLWNPGNM